MLALLHFCQSANPPILKKSMVEKDYFNRKPYQYPVSLFGPRSSKQEISVYDYDSRLISKQNLPPKSPVEHTNGELGFSTKHRIERQADLEGTASGYGEYYCPEGIPIETALFLILGAAGLSFGALFRAITLKTGGRRRKRSNGESNDSYLENNPSLFELISDLSWSGRLLNSCVFKVYLTPFLVIT